MYYDRVAFDDGVVAWREIDAAGHTTRYCDDAGADIGRLYERVNIVEGSPLPPSWALQDAPEPPPQEPAPTLPDTITKMEFLDALGASYERIIAASRDSVPVQAWLERFKVAPDPMRRSDPRLKAGLLAMEDAGLVDPGTAERIVGA